MTIATATLSSKGQVVIPKNIRDQLHWEGGHELIIETTDSGVLLKTKPAAKTLRLEDLRGFLQADGPAVPIDELCKPVECGAEHRYLHNSQAVDFTPLSQRGERSEGGEAGWG